MYIQIHRVLFLVRTLINPCLERIIVRWHSSIKTRFQGCSTLTKCPPNCKPSKNTHCRSCIKWASAIEKEFYSTEKHSPQWENVNTAQFHTNPDEVIKAFFPHQDEELKCMSLDDLDEAGFLCFLVNFTPFHQKNKEAVHLIQGVSSIGFQGKEYY